jgi:hypothetical protein
MTANKHHQTLNWFWIFKPVPGFVEKEKDNNNQNNGIKQGRQDFNAFVTKGFPVGSVLFPDQIGQVSDKESRSISQVMKRIGKQGQTV